MSDTVAKEHKKPEWRCFHCDETFTGFADACAHFGRFEESIPACQIDIAEYRRMEKALAMWQAEDTDLHREIYRLNARLTVVAREEEEKGYARGLADGRATLIPERSLEGGAVADMIAILRSRDLEIPEFHAMQLPVAAALAKAQERIAELERSLAEVGKLCVEQAIVRDTVTRAAAAAQGDAERLRGLLRKRPVDPPMVRGECFGVGWTERGSSAPLVRLLTQDDGNWFEGMAFDASWLPELVSLFSQARAAIDSARTGTTMVHTIAPTPAAI